MAEIELLEGRAGARLVDCGVKVWRIIDHLRRWDSEKVQDYLAVTEEEIEAALAYYKLPAYKPYIDAKILLEDDALGRYPKSELSEVTHG